MIEPMLSAIHSALAMDSGNVQITIGPLEDDGSIPIDLKVGPVHYYGAASDIVYLVDEVYALLKIAHE